MPEHAPITEGLSAHVCPACKQPVADVAERHKSMGVVFPVWAAGPCHNPQCTEYVAKQEHVAAHHDTAHPR